ncbi:MAG: hypothetical protein ABI480_18005 [Chitinophagaceae bacterium]
MKNLLLPALLCMAIFSSAQKTIKVSKGKIKSGDEVIAEYDGHGSMFRNGSYTVTLPGSKDALITLEEVNHTFYNPLLDELHLFYQVKFSTGDSFYVRPRPATGKAFGIAYVRYDRKVGNDIIEEIFNDTLPIVIENKVLNKEAVGKLIAKANAYPFETIMANAKALEDSIAMYAKTPITRDIKKPITFQLIGKPADATTTEGNWFTITQDSLIIGRLYKYLDEQFNKVTYTVWRKAADGAVLQGRSVGFVPILTTKRLMNNYEKKYEAIKISGKDIFIFYGANYLSAEMDLVGAAVGAGLL